MNREDIARMVDNDGISYFIESYSSSGDMPDQELELAFERLADSIRSFRALLPEVKEM